MATSPSAHLAHSLARPIDCPWACLTAPSCQVVEEGKEEGKDSAADGAAGEGDKKKEERETINWTSVDRLQMSIGLLFALCNYAIDLDVRCSGLKCAHAIWVHHMVACLQRDTVAVRLDLDGQV